MWNAPSLDLGGYIETVRRGAFSDSMANGADVRALVNHESGKILGRSTSGTLRLREDSIGLKFECDVSNTNAGRDVVESISRHDLHQCSFAFRVQPDGERWYENGDGTIRRELTKLSTEDVPVVTFAAYPQTTVHGA